MALSRIFDDLIKKLSPKLFKFQSTGYSFEEWFNWELFFALDVEGWNVNVNPRILGGKKFADVEIVDFENGKNLKIEVKIIHDFTQNKWIAEIEKDRKALEFNSLRNGDLGLQVLLITSSYNDVLSVESWSDWLNKLSFWSVEPDYNFSSKQSEGESILMAWRVDG